MIEGPEVYYSCSDCVLSFVKAASNGVYVEATTDHARCSTGCRAKATFVCRVYPDEPVSPLKETPDSVLKEEPKESCKTCSNMTVTENTLFKVFKGITQVFPYEEGANKVINELLNSGILFRERI